MLERHIHGGHSLVEQHSLTRNETPDAPLVQRFEPPGGRPVSVNLTFLASRPKLGRILANTFWMTYHSGPRRKTVLAIAWVLRIFCSFLDHRAKSMPDVLEAVHWGPASKGTPKQLVVLCHGLGADAYDLIDLAPSWAER